MNRNKLFGHCITGTVLVAGAAWNFPAGACVTAAAVAAYLLVRRWRKRRGRRGGDGITAAGPPSGHAREPRPDTADEAAMATDDNLKLLVASADAPPGQWHAGSHAGVVRALSKRARRRAAAMNPPRKEGGASRFAPGALRYLIDVP